ncbi:MAG: hypothetical protein JSV03_15750 [Planctomycetota bacterium]|nr:MAG: hypothetical protein JSV03_15750 [Planctomycetota bacterium]
METNTKIDEALAALRLIVLGMIGGVVIFVVIVLAVGNRFEGQPELSSIMLPILVLAAAVAIFVPIVIRRNLIGQARRVIDDVSEDENSTERIIGFVNAYIIISAAVAEGYGLFATVVYLLTKSVPALLMAVIALALLMKRFPNRSLVDKFVAEVSSE